MNDKKCVFFEKQVNILGHVVLAEELLLIPVKKAVQKFPKQKTKMKSEVLYAFDLLQTVG